MSHFVIYFIWGLFNNAVSSSDYTASDEPIWSVLSTDKNSAITFQLPNHLSASVEIHVVD
jgi:hypothetical protein